MSQGYNLRFDKMRENNPAAPAAENESSTASQHQYDAPGHTRNVCFVWPDGKRMFFNYAYLIAAEFEPGDERNEIALTFSRYTVNMRGFGLESLFTNFLDHVPRIITVIDERYASTINSGSPAVIIITVQKNDE